MKTRINSQLKNKKGLTLIQTLIVIAIVVILLGVAFIGVQSLVNRIKQTKLDNIAQSMYVSAQNRIWELKASGEIDSLLEHEELTAVVNQPADWGEVDPDDDSEEAVKYSDLKYFYHNKDDSASSDLVDFIFPQGSISEDVLDDNWVIELDPVTGYVYAAFYSETRSAKDFYIDNTDTLDQSGTSSIRFKDFRHSLKGNDKIGYYGGKANMPADANGYIIHASMNVINADILEVRMNAIIPLVEGVTSDLEFKLTVKGKISNNTVTLTPDVSFVDIVTAREFSAAVILDKLADGQNFKATFGDANWKPINYVESRTGALTPGEDLELSFTVSSSDDRVLDIDPIERTANSLFASLNQAEPTEANIAYGRHLQNLDNSTSGLPAGAITAAKQISDIDFNDESYKDLPVEKPFLWKSLYGDKTFTPINNPSLNKYSGYIDVPSATDSFKILNMHIAGNNKPAGLFGDFAGDEISGLTMVNTKIEGGTNVGGLAGTTNSSLTIKDCRLYVERDYFATGSTYADNILFKGTTNVGGLVGSSTGDITIKDSFAATIIEGSGSIGGLIGKASGNAQIQDSYADSYLIGGASTSKIGGLAGELAAGSSISGSYSAGFAIIKNTVTEEKIAAAAGFVPNGISSVTNSYSLFNCSESKATDIYSTVPSATTVTNVYYFGGGETVLAGSLEYNFTSNEEAAAQFIGSNFSDDNNEYDSYPYNQKTDLEPQTLVTYPYVSIEGLPHYGDWKIPPIPEIPEEPEFGKAGLFYWERVIGGSAPGYKIYLVGRKKVESENEKYEAVYYNTTNTTHNDRGIVKEYGYGYFIAKKADGTEYKLVKKWENVNESATNPIQTNASADAYFDKNYKGYKFYCYTTCDEKNLATSYNTNGVNAKKYMFMTKNVQNAIVTLTPEDEPALKYTFSPFFAKSIKLAGWNKLAWNYTGTRPALQNDPGTEKNEYRIRSLDQLQFINWNNLSRTNDLMTNNKTNKPLWNGGRYYCKHFPYLISTKVTSLIVRNAYNYWVYGGILEELSDFSTLRERQNFIQDYDIECIRRTGYTPIAALGETSGQPEACYRLPFFAWFGGSFDGQSYKIKNLSITSGCYSVGVFGLTVSATIKNVVLIRDSKDTVPVIKRPAGSPEGYYAIGTLVGMANEYSDGKHNKGVSPYNYVGKIENCAVAGYEVIDESNQSVYCGETTIGGLAGVLRTNINRCSAVTTIRINTYRYRGTSVIGINYEDNITVGGIAGTNQTRIYNCYSGGRVIVNPDLVYTDPDANGIYKLNIYISGIASSAFTCRSVNMHSHNDQSSVFISPKYYNCYSYMDLPQPQGNMKVAVIGGDACYNENDFLPKQLGGELNNCHYYANHYKTDQMIISDEPGWVNNGIYPQSHDAMSQEQFCTDLNSSSSPAPYRKITSSNYSFPCGDVSLEDKIFPFPAVITQGYSGEYVHYGEWPIERRLELAKSEMSLDLISYHNDEETGTIIDDFYDETEVKFYYGESYQDIELLNLEIKKGDDWINLVDNQPVIINDKVSVTASVDETEGSSICKLTVTGIDKTEVPEIISLRYAAGDGYYGEVQLEVEVTAVVNLSANPITDTMVKPGEIVKWNLILKDNIGNLIDSKEMAATDEYWDFPPSYPANPENPEAVVFSLSITKEESEPSPFYLEATAQNAGEADFTIQALNIEVRDKTNRDSDGNIRTFNSNIVSDLHASCYTTKLILKHHVGDGTEAYTDNSYICNNGDSGIAPELISTDTEKPFSTLRDDMIARDSRFAGWYIKDETSDNHQKVLNSDGTIFTDDGDIPGITENGKFKVDSTEGNPADDIELYAMWKISYTPLTFVTGPEPPETLDNTTDTIIKYLVLARAPREEAINPEYYCMTGVVNPSTDSPVTVTKVDLHQDAQGKYYLTSLVSENTMLWDVTQIKNTKYFKLFNNNLESYIKPVSNKIYDVVFCKEKDGVNKPQYDSANHNLFFSGQDRIVLNGTQTGFSFEHMKGQGTGQNPDGGIWLFKYSLDSGSQEILYEFK